jgi:hypothetical protein
MPEENHEKVIDRVKKMKKILNNIYALLENL